MRQHLKVYHEGEYTGMVPMSKELVDWADVIVCMESSHRITLHDKFGDEIKDKMCTLGIPDRFEYDDPVLRQRLREKVHPYKWK